MNCYKHLTIKEDIMDRIFMFLSVLLACFSVAAVQAVDYDSFTFEELSVLASQDNDAIAQTYLGKLYYYGFDVEQDSKEAFKWFSMAADQKHPEAIYKLGEMYIYGNGVEQDEEEGLKRYFLAAELGYDEVQNLLGIMYEIGDMVEQSYEQACHWYTLAAQQGDLAAQYKLGELYYFEEYEMQDFKQAHKWFEMVADQGLSDALYYLGEMYEHGYGVQPDLETAYMYYLLSSEYANEVELEDFFDDPAMIKEKLSPQQRERIIDQAREWMEERGFL